MDAPPTSRLAERLRMAREDQGVSLAQATADTRILNRYLEALESGDFNELPSDVAARGFIRNYAEYLKLPPEELLGLYRSERGSSEPIKVQSVTSAPRIPNLMLPSVFGVLFVVLTLAGLGYLMLSTTNRIGESAVAQISVPTVAAVLPPVPTAAANATAIAVALAPTAQPPRATEPAEGAGGVPRNGAAAALPTVTAVSGAPIVGEVRVGESGGRGSWVNVLVDGKSVFQGVIADGKVRPFTARRSVELRIGNAGPVSVMINGQEFSSLGGTGDAVTFRWPR